jgi:hypothetical protein
VTLRPNFLYIGPDKAGSSWLHEVLITHPQVFLTPAKDIYFFDRYFDRGPAWYLSHFSQARPEQSVIGEVCQDYLSEPEAPRRIRDVLGPDVRFMVTLRDPVERAFSSYLYMLKHGETPGSFADALVGRPELIEHGSYGAGLARFLDVFPREQLHVALFDDLAADPQGFIDDVLSFLAVDPLTLSDELLAARLPASRARSVGMARAVRRAAEWVRLANGAEFVGRVKRSRYVQAALYKPYGDDKPRLSGEDAQRVRDLLAEDAALLEDLVGVPVRARWGWLAKAIAS